MGTPQRWDCISLGAVVGAERSRRATDQGQHAPPPPARTLRPMTTGRPLAGSTACCQPRNGSPPYVLLLRPARSCTVVQLQLNMPSGLIQVLSSASPSRLLRCCGGCWWIALTRSQSRRPGALAVKRHEGQRPCGFCNECAIEHSTPARTRHLSEGS